MSSCIIGSRMWFAEFIIHCLLVSFACWPNIFIFRFILFYLHLRNPLECHQSYPDLLCTKRIVSKTHTISLYERPKTFQKIHDNSAHFKAKHMYLFFIPFSHPNVAFSFPYLSVNLFEDLVYKNASASYSPFLDTVYWLFIDSSSLDFTAAADADAAVVDWTHYCLFASAGVVVACLQAMEEAFHHSHSYLLLLLSFQDSSSLDRSSIHQQRSSFPVHSVEFVGTSSSDSDFDLEGS